MCNFKDFLIKGCYLNFLQFPGMLHVDVALSVHALHRWFPANRVKLKDLQNIHPGVNGFQGLTFGISDSVFL